MDLRSTTTAAGSRNLPLTEAATLFAPESTFLDTASYGLAPATAALALEEAVDTWRSGRATAGGYDPYVSEARALFARLVGVDTGNVAVGSQASAFAGLVAASLPEGSEVVTADCEFTSVLFPFLAQERRGVRVRLVPLSDLPAAIDTRTCLVAVSAVQSCDGRVADLAAVRDAAAAVGARTFVDATQACGWLPLDAARFDYVVCSAYKWLLAPRGATFFTVRSERLDALVPHHAGWYAGEDVWTSIYGGPLRLARTARRFDLSPAWLAWVGAAPALRLLDQVGVAAIHAHNLALADRFRAGLGMPPSDSAIVSVPGIADASDRLTRAGVTASVRAGAVRVAFHLYSTEADVDRALEALTA
ncbi:MAG: aminotransferase class V-fold PLP-dependent enzyme, partial [Carbonactinosporaceae bacterium]